jgi:hypothetical protein
MNAAVAAVEESRVPGILRLANAGIRTRLRQNESILPAPHTGDACPHHSYSFIRSAGSIDSGRGSEFNARLSELGRETAHGLEQLGLLRYYGN